MDLARERETHDAGVIDDNNDDGERAEKIETGLALAVLEARIDSDLSTASLRQEGRCSFGRGFRNGRNLAAGSNIESLRLGRGEDGR
jgi:hypothetical protein